MSTRKMREYWERIKEMDKLRDKARQLTNVSNACYIASRKGIPRIKCNPKADDLRQIHDLLAIIENSHAQLTSLKDNQQFFEDDLRQVNQRITIARSSPHAIIEEEEEEDIDDLKETLAIITRDVLDIKKEIEQQSTIYNTAKERLKELT